MTWQAVFNNPITPTGALLTQASARRGLKVSGGYVISDVSPSRKRVTIYYPGSTAGGKFAGKTYTYSWDGTGFKRQGQYLYEEGPAENPTAVARAARKIREIRAAQGGSLQLAARIFASRYERLAYEVMDRVGSWPSSEPEIRALQEVWS